MGWASCFRCYVVKKRWQYDLKIPRDFSIFTALAALAVIAALTVPSLLYLPYQIGFSLPALNYWLVACLTLAVPFLLFRISHKWESKWPKTLVSVLSVLFCYRCLALSLLDAQHLMLQQPIKRDMDRIS